MRTKAKHAFGTMTFIILAGICATSSAHMVFKKHLQQKYLGMKVNCNACHVKGKPKTERNAFGKLFAKELKATNPALTQDWKSKKGNEKKKYETETMVPAFDQALAKVKTLANEKQEVYDELIKSGKIPEIKKDPKYKPETNSTTPSGGDRSNAQTKDESVEKDNSGKSKQEPKSNSSAKSKNG